MALDPISLQQPVRRYFRRRRFKSFLADYQSCHTILDVGGEPSFWSLIGRRQGITILNVREPGNAEGFPFVLGSGCQMPFADKSFDLAFSNSAIEHVGSEENQLQFACEMLRVGKRVHCQTPSRLFPIDPHINMPFLHWLPRSWLTPRFLRYCTVNGWLWKKPYEYDVTWISKRRLQKMFPGCKVTTERFLLWPKSFTVTS